VFDTDTVFMVHDVQLPPVHDFNGQESYLGIAVSNMSKTQNKNEFGARQTRIAQRMFR
jgi:hypothetical protein